MLQLLQKEGVRISDAALRKLLSELESRGLVEIGKGRQGTSITAAGRESLAPNGIK